MLVKKFAIEVVRPTAIVIESNEEHDNQHALVDSDVGLGLHETKVKIGCQCDRALACFLFQIGEWRRPGGDPFNQSILADAGNVDAVAVTNLSNHAFGDALRLVIGIEPAADQLIAVQLRLRRIRESRIQMTTLFEFQD